MKCYICHQEVRSGHYKQYSCDMPGIDEVLFVCIGDCDDFFNKTGRYAMRFKPGQKIVINKNRISREQDRAASKLDPPYVATISHICPDPHDGRYMYCLDGCPWGWYDSEIEKIYEEQKPKNIFDVIDLD
jgi:hypothetical protein